MYLLVNTREKNGEVVIDLEIPNMMRLGENRILGEFHINKFHLHFCKTAPEIMSRDRIKSIYEAMEKLHKIGREKILAQGGMT